MRNNKWIFMMVIAMLVIVAGCGQKPSNTEGSKPGNGGANSGITDPVTASPGNSDPSSQEEKATIDAYFTDDDMLELKKLSKEISYSDDVSKYEAAFKAIQDSGDEKLFSLWGKVILNSLKLVDGEVTLDITLPDEARLGAGGESLAIDSLKATLFQFPEVKTIELLVDGVKVDTLMGHDELEHPMTRD